MNIVMSDSGQQNALATMLLSNLEAFHHFARRRLGDEQLAADAVQESLLRALKNEPDLRHKQNLLAWFYRILRNVLNDLYRRRLAQKQALEKFGEQTAIDHEDAGLEQILCGCFRDVLPTLRPEYAEVLQLSDLEGLPAEVVAAKTGISRGNLKVRLHRARKQLRERLEQICQTCALHGCFDCQCNPQGRDRK